MQPDEAERLIDQNVSVTQQKIAIMKGLILSHGTIHDALQAVDATKPTTIILHPDVDPMPLLGKASDWISYSLAGCEAIWQLIHAGILVQLSDTLTPFTADLDWTTVYGHGGGRSAGWRFGRFKSSYPSRFVPSWASDRDQILADADLYLQKLSLPDFHHEIQDSLRDAVRCFRAELFTPSVVMLGKASEGAWIELGVALAAVVGAADAKAKKWSEELVGPDIGFAKKLRDILQFYETRQNQFKVVGQQADVSINDLRLAMLWADTLRDARNAIHHRVATRTDHSYETVATLLLATVPHLQTVYRLYQAAITEASRTVPSLP